MARSSVTAKQLIYDAKALLGIRDSMYPNNSECIRFLNYSVFTLSNLLNGLYKVWEIKTSALTRRAGNNVNSALTECDYVSSTRTITKSAHGVTTASIGGIVAMFDNDDSKGYLGILESVPTVNTLVLVTDPVGENIPNAGAAVGATVYIMNNPWYSEGASLSALLVKSFESVKDATNGQMVPLGAVEFESMANNPNLASSIGYFDFADGLHWKNGSSITTINAVKTLHYNADPAEITAITDSVDLETEHHAMIVADVARQIEKAYPDLGKRANQGDPFAELRKLYAAKEQEFLNQKTGLDVSGRAE